MHLGIDLTVAGHKHSLDDREGATLNATLVAGLLDSLEAWGLTITSRVLFILDYRPKTMHPEARRKLRAVFGLKDASQAEKALTEVLA